MVDLVPLHSMLVELHGGMITLAVVCILATIIARSQLKLRSISESSGVLWPTNSNMGTVARYAEPTAYVATIGGVLGLIASAITGFFIWSFDQLTAFAIGPNKVALSIFALVLLVEFVFIRSKYGENLWKSRGVATIYSCLGIIGFLFIVIAGSLGGHMALKGSVLDPLYALLNITPETFGPTGFNYIIMLIAVVIIEIVVPMIILLRLQRPNQLKGS